MFYYVRDRVRYTSDIDLFGYDEFAQNADELAGIMVEQNRRGYGDCEDSAVLLAVICKGAGLRGNSYRRGAYRRPYLPARLRRSHRLFRAFGGGRLDMGRGYGAG